MFFWNSLPFSMIQWKLTIWSLVLTPLLNPSWTSGSSQFTYCWNLAWRIFEHYIASVWDECYCAVVWTFCCVVFLWDWNENDLFQSCGHCWVFQICWHIEYNTFTASSLRIRNSSTGILSPPLALFIVMLLKAHLTSHSSVGDHTIVVNWVMMIFFV